MSDYVIRRSDGRFWVGPGRWSVEYPDAFKFDSWKAAAKKSLDSNPSVETPRVISVVSDYGTADEHTVLLIKPQTP